MANQTRPKSSKKSTRSAARSAKPAKSRRKISANGSKARARNAPPKSRASNQPRAVRGELAKPSVRAAALRNGHAGKDASNSRSALSAASDPTAGAGSTNGTGADAPVAMAFTPLEMIARQQAWGVNIMLDAIQLQLRLFDVWGPNNR